MKLNTKSKNIILDITCLLYVFLLVYAAMNKGLDFENFKVELGQSPLLSAFADWISWAVLIGEFVIAILLLFPSTRIKGLYAGFCLMTMFTAYIFIMLNYSSFLPCSCGGILEKMSWQEHLLFNIFFVLIAGLALWLNHPQSNSGKKSTRLLSYPIQLVLTFLLSCVAVIILFLTSEEIIHHQNPFIRRYPHHPITLTHTLDLKYNSYYFAGAGNGKLYLGNYTVPMYLLSIDNKLQQQKIRATFNRDSFSFKSVRMSVRPPFFYIIDGSAPAIFSGRITNWKAKLQEPRPPYFGTAVPIDSSTIAFRGISKTNSNNILGVFTAGSQSKISMAPELLQKQIDGVFDTDGMLHYSEEMKRIVYLYSYRNEYIVADENGTLDYRGNTIDTVSRAQIKVAYLKEKTEQTMAKPTLTVNACSSVFGHLLFVNSNVPGRYEQKEVWKQASVIDVYDLNKKAYLFSFHIYGIDGKKLRNFLVTPTHVYVLIDTKLVVYQLNEILKNEIKRVAGKSL
ncbi:MauE/DoxX family redox-associated membrane protein [Flavobacterium hydatis]|uniref:Methylamine utilisation protein MauE domain-containing protein n=1 Tax=Flavobacterium hydatis TaxID=991 RepID=A0A086AM58_FLAHY|nr:MauE/DoxX family redox-associated membrane protein [Flavobacterium hydatis]KFF17772.1 hypothetical protein IW20_07330 [Flavobacterium hydatis]OXA93692.1 hypothetical protein B0A62_13170 [Flavobacterium hydatis]